MSDQTGTIVRAKAGRDRGGLFCVVGEDREKGMLLLANGKRRRAARPKRKKPAHVETLDCRFDHPAIQKLKQGGALTDKELRRALAAFRDQFGGMTLWQKTT